MKTIIIGSDFPDDLKKELLLRAKEVANRLPEEERKDVNIVELVDLECVKDSTAKESISESGKCN
jgi:hypothetical protein